MRQYCKWTVPLVYYFKSAYGLKHFKINYIFCFKVLNSPYFIFFFRPLREDGPDAEREEDQEEEDLHQEVYPQSLLQRVIHLRASLRVHPGKPGLL